MDKLRRQIREFYGGRAPKVLDPFAGGGAIPLEAMRSGCEVTASDLNPVAWFILKCTLDYPQKLAGLKWPLPEFVNEWPDFVEDFLAGKVKKRKPADRPHFNDSKQYSFSTPPKPLDNDVQVGAFNSLPDADLAWQVRAWGRWVMERARQDLAARYPTVNDQPTVAYLWARTARDPRTGGRIPLLKTFWLCRKRGNRTALLPIPEEDGSSVRFKLLREQDLDQPQRIIDEHPHLQTWEITSAKLIEFLNAGTMNRAGVWSPCSGRPDVVSLLRKDLRRQGQQGLLGEQMTAVVTIAIRPNSKKTFKQYRLPKQEELNAVLVEFEELDSLYSSIPFGIPNEPIVEDAKRNTWCVGFGVKRWSSLFLNRQLLCVGTILMHTRAASALIRESNPELAECLLAYSGLALSRFISFNCKNVRWKLDAMAVIDAFARFAIPILWDFAEVNPLSDSAGSFQLCFERIATALDNLLASYLPHQPKVQQVSALTGISSEELDLVMTDPPYYDEVGYSVVMDFFYVWLRRLTQEYAPALAEAFKEDLSPKWNAERQDGELVDDSVRFGGDKAKSKQNYEDGIAKVFHRSCECLGNKGRMLVVFANKDFDAWETLIGGLIRGGAVVTASWPIKTEMPNRARSLASSALSSSVWIVSRKRADSAQFGWDVTVLERMREILFDARAPLGNRNILQYYFDLGIKGPDFLWAALGPALEAYSEHPFVKKTEGGLMTVPEFLGEVRKLVLHFALGELPGFHDLQSQIQGRGESVELDAVTQYYLLHRSSFGLEPTPAGPCIMYAQACGKTETELKVVWNVIEQGGQSKKGRPRKDSDESEEGEQSSGNEFRLRGWKERVTDEKLGEPHNGQPAPLIDRLHRLVFLFHRNQAAEVQTQYEAWGLASERAFPALLQATRELAMRDRQDTERRLIEAIATQLNFTRRQVVEGEVVKDEPFFPAIVSYGKKD